MEENEPGRRSSATTWLQVLEQRTALHPERQGYCFTSDGENQEAGLTYAELDRQARTVAARLQALCLPGSRAILLYPPGLEFISGLFGCWYAGIIAVPAYPPRSAHHVGSLATLGAIAADSEPAVVLTAARSRSMIEAAQRAVPALTGVPTLATDSDSTETADSWRDPQVTGESVACLQYTSGSTATPKGVVLTHSNLLENSAVIRECFGHSAASQGVIWLPPYHDMGLIGGVLQPLFAGFPVTLMAPAAFLQRPIRWLHAITRFGGTTSGGPNFAYELCIKQTRPEDRAGLDLGTWDVAFNGAEPIDPRTIDRFVEAFAPCGFRREAFYPCYGLAESTLIVSGGEKSAAPVVQSICPEEMEKHRVVRPIADRPSKSFVGCGRARSAESIVIVDPATRRPCDAGRIGEIWTRSASVASGYWRNAKATAEVFNDRLDGSGEGPFLRTGDLGFLDGDELFVTGRLKDLIIIRGRNHYPHDIEQSVQESHSALRPASGAAFSVSEDAMERLVVVQEVERTQRDSDLDAVIATIRQAVAEKHDLAIFAVMLVKPGQIPKTSSGKIRRDACRTAYLKGQLEQLAFWKQAFEPAEDESPELDPETSEEASLSAEQLEDLITEKVAAAVGVPPGEIEPAEPFARYGLDSAGAVELAGTLSDLLGRELSGTLFYDYPSPHELALHLAGLPAPAPNVTH